MNMMIARRKKLWSHLTCHKDVLRDASTYRFGAHSTSYILTTQTLHGATFPAALHAELNSASVRLVELK